jgi:hypothetical protein
MEMSRPLRLSSMMQLPIVTSQGAERPLKTQRDAYSGRSIESGGGDGDEHAAEGEQHDAAVPTATTQSVNAAEEAARHAGRPAPR